MPRYRFIAADSLGQLSDGTIDAATQADARRKLASNGLAVRELEEVAPGAEPPLSPAARRSAVSGNPVEPLPMRRPPRAEPAGEPTRGSSAPLILSIIALVVAVGSAIYSTTRDPFSSRLNRYDFSNPEAAYLSHLRMQAAADLPAMMELQRRSGESKKLRDKLDAIQVRRAEPCGSKTILFIEYTVDAIQTREIAYFERDPDQSKIWRPTHMSEVEIRGINAELADRVRDWPRSRTGDFVPLGGRRGGADD
jgi:hypothetical protein